MEANQGDFGKVIAASNQVRHRSPELMGTAAIFLAMETAETFTGNVITDVEAIRRFKQQHEPFYIPGTSVVEPYMPPKEWRSGERSWRSYPTQVD